MPEALKEFDIREMRKEIMLLPDFHKAFRQIELSRKKDALLGLLEDGTYLEILFTPHSYGMARVQTRKISREAALADYVSPGGGSRNTKAT